METDAFRVLLVEDEKHARERLSAAITAHPRLELQDAVGAISAARRSLETGIPDVLLTDLGLPDGSGIELIRAAQANTPQTAVMVVTVFGDERHVIEAIEAGATGYVLKDDHPERIGQSIMELLAGGSPISAPIARHLLKRFRPASIEVTHPEVETATLTDREQEVLRLVTKGFAFGEIAAVLDISNHTVTSHIKNIYRKLAVHSRSQAVFEALQLGLVRANE